MSLIGWLIMILAVGGTTSFLAWCVFRVVAHDPDAKENLHGFEVDPGDKES